jgi:acyl-CoA synthetase (AMP-forming)/AMP-acid ligase II
MFTGGPAPALAPTFWQQIEETAAHLPDYVLMEDEHGRSLTTADFRDECARVAAGLLAAGITPGTIVSWMLPTSIDTLVVMGALSRLGAVQNPIITMLREREVRYITNEARTEVLLHRTTFRGTDYAALVTPIADDIGFRTMAVDTLPTGDPATLPPPATAEPARRLLYYTSGSTSDPKGVWHSERSAMAGGSAWVAAMRPDGNDVYPVVFPVAHIGGIGMTTAALRGPYRMFVVEAWDPQRTPLAAAERGATLLGTALPFFRGYMDAQLAHGDLPLFPALRACVSGGAPKPDGLHDEVRATLGGCGVLGGWGLTEFPGASSAGPYDPDDMMAVTEGKLGPGVTMKVIAGDGHECGELEEGELRLRGLQAFLGYANPALDADAFDEDGFVRTGDLGVVQPGGYVQITGRLKDIIIRNAENISATEIEDCLFLHPAVADVAVIGVPDPRTVERAVAVVQLAPGQSSFTLADVAQHCLDHGLAKWKIPEQLELVDAIPRNGMGKIEKPALRQRYAT